MPKHPPSKQVLTLVADRGLVKWLKRYSFERGVSMNKLCVDLLTIFCIAAWNPNDPTLEPRRVGAKLPARPEPPNGDPDYLADLVFTLPEEGHDATT